MSLIGELRRRQVFRAAAWYAAAAWLAIQVASTVIPEFGLPEWLVRAVIVAAVLGLPVALALAWSFDLSRLGVRRESSAHVEKRVAGDADAAAMTATTVAPLWRIPSFWIALVLGAGLAVSAQQAWQRIVRPAFGERPAIAVLPFANLSPDPENAFFADGLHEEILATLARTSSLRVISRTSVQQYRDTTRNLREIADALDVSLILEGSVRREGDDLRLTLQLIDGRSDEHLWAETYDRKFENALHLQQAVAQQIVASIGAQLTPAEDRLIERSVPADPGAYAFYLRALAHWNPIADQPELRIAEGLLSRALELDPDFALGYALRAKVRVWILASIENPSSETIPADARPDIERALALHPGLPEALVARASYLTYVERDAAAALPDLNRALELAPNDADAHNMAGLIKRRLGRFEEALAHFRESARLRPTAGFSVRTVETLDGLGRYEEAARGMFDFQRRFPEWHAAAELGRYRMRFMATGETTGWEEAHQRVAPLLDPELRGMHTIHLCLATGDLARLAAYLEGEPSVPTVDVILGGTYSAMGDAERARPHLQRLVDQMSEAPGGATSEGAIALLLLGRTDEAIRAADAAAREVPESRDAVNGPTVAIDRAWVLIRSGGDHAEEGYAELERLLGKYRLQPRAYSITPPGRMLAEDPRAARIIREAIEKQDAAHAAAPEITSPAPAADRPR